MAISTQAQTTRTWDGGGVSGTDLLTPANWSGDAVPASTGTDGTTTRQDAQWNNTVTGPLSLTYGAAFGGGSGVGLVLTSAQTSALTITNSAASSQIFRLISSAATTTGGIQIASGAGAFTLGAAGTSNAIDLRLGSTANANYYFNNNSSNTATIHENVTISRGGVGASNLYFGAGTWDVKGVISIATSGSVATYAGANVTLSGNNTFDTPLYLNGGTLNFSAANNLGTNTSTPIRLGFDTTATLRYTGAGDTTLTRQVTIGSTNAAAFNPTIDSSGAGTLTFGNATFNVAQASNTARILILRGTSTGNNTISGTIGNNTSGAVSLQKLDAGTWVLGGNNTFSGKLYVDSGTLAFSAANNLGTNATEIRVGQAATTGRLLYTGAGDTTISRQILVGSGTGAGGSIIDASGSSTGALTFSAANFNLADAAATSTRTLYLTGSNTAQNTISGIIANNTGSQLVRVQKQGTGTWVLGGNNTFSGNLYVDNGTLSFSALNNLGTNAAAIRIGEATTSGRLLYTGAADTTITRQVEIGSTNVGAGSAIVDSSGNGTLSFSNANFNAAVGTISNTRALWLQGSNTGNNTVAGVIANNTSGVVNLAKYGAGKWILTGNNTYTGTTQVNAGTLLVNNTVGSGLGAGNVDVGTTGKLGGTGAFTAAVNINSGGTLSPGASIETLGSGALTFNHNSTFEYEVKSSVATSVGADLQKVTGNLGLNGTVTLTLTDLALTPSAFADGTTFTLINYTGVWNNGLFTYDGKAIVNGGDFTAGLNTWRLDYNATTGGLNFSGEYAGGSNYVNITAIPEPSGCYIFAGGLASLVVFHRRRRA
jgi:fibronectin-binding autotransporter adhesin